MKIFFLIFVMIMGFVFVSVSIVTGDDSWVDKAFKKNQEMLGDQIYTGSQPSGGAVSVHVDDGNGGQDIGERQLLIQQPMFDPVTGNLLVPTAGGLIDPETQSFYLRTTDGYKNAQTGKFTPAY